MKKSHALMTHWLPHLFPKALSILFLLIFSCVTYSGEMSSGTSDNKVFKESWITTKKTHQYLGLAALTLGSLTAIAPKPSPNDYEGSLHYNLALGATYLGGAALGTGFVFHYKDLTWNNMFRNPDNLHAMFATVGTLGFLLALGIAPDIDHTTPGIVGIAGMATAIKITW